jgi:hypothetical protein
MGTHRPEMPMPRLSDKIVLKPKPVTGPLLAIALGLDRVHPGYLRYLTTASALKRQTNFVALSILDEMGLTILPHISAQLA